MCIRDRGSYMEFIEISAKNVDDAITQATVQLGITSDQLEYCLLYTSVSSKISASGRK